MKQPHKRTHQAKVDRANRIARYVITLGGYGIILSIIAILLFLLYQSMPLSFGASVKELLTLKVKHAGRDVMLTGIDQYQEVAYILQSSGKIRFYDLSDQSILMEDSLNLQKGETILTAAKGSLNEEIMAVGTDRGRLISADVKMQPRFENGRRKIIPSFHLDGSFQAEPDSGKTLSHIERLAYLKNKNRVQFWSWQNHDGKLRLRIDDPEEAEPHQYDLSQNLGGAAVTQITMSYDGEKLIVGTRQGELFWFDLTNFDRIYLRDHWKASQTPISGLSFLIGNNGLVIGSASGRVAVWFPVRDRGNNLKFQAIHRFQPHPAPVSQIYSSPRDRSFLTIDSKGNVHLNFSTSDQTRLRFTPVENTVQTAAFAPKADGIVVVDGKNRLGQYQLENPHPEATLKTLFGKVWYEGYPKPEFVWQSTGGSDQFESKLSLIPLIFGTMKGTLYAMIFSIPLALLGAIYVSQFSPKWLGRIVKPTVEIMAALPSVVIGFLAGLYFSPLFERHLMTLFLFVFLIPLFLVIGILLWRLVPEERRMRAPTGWELLVTIPLMVLSFWLATQLAHPVEMGLFSGSVKQWIYENLNLQYDQRNSVVVGFALGFAVIPIIFTISEDALSNVPQSLTSASLALGASRWQTVRRVVLPAAAGGIFAGIMLGFGRAIGETMIVLMATGNTPIIDLNPFNGFRAMSACIAVEIPEAPVGGTLYRVLFLTAFLLFVFTFIVNTLAAIISDRLRKKYARF